MNFFEHQDRAQRRTKMLLLLFLLAILTIILAVNLIILFSLSGYLSSDEAFFSRQFLGAHSGLILWVTAITAGIIGFSSLYRNLALRSGGGVVARELGGSLVDPSVTDPLRRRLLNIVEEMAIASGVPVPEIYILEQENGINAFAAGYSPADAAIAVTRGALETLNRSELQGVIAHEFGHILNGDMRLNIRLIGILFGILVMAVIGRRILYSVRFTRGRRGSGAGGVMALGLALLLVGYIGLFFGRWIKASISRQREYLADASAVQFTRQPEGIAGALKKIGAASSGSRLQADTEEITHMLFASGFAQRIFATHPPLTERIRAIEPGFSPSEFKTVRERMQRHAESRAAALEAASETGKTKKTTGNLHIDADNIIGQIGRPGPGQILVAATLAAALPSTLQRAARSHEWAPELILYLLMARDAKIRERQLEMIAVSLGVESENQVKTLLQAVPVLPAGQRMPLLEISFPALRRLPATELAALLDLMERLIHVDNRVEVFEYALARLLARQIKEAVNPARAGSPGSRKPAESNRQIRDVLTILASQGRPDRTGAQEALQAGLQCAGLEYHEGNSDLPVTDGWPDRLDRALDKLDRLTGEGKQVLLRAMLATVSHDGTIAAAEMELLRVICASLHMPLPPADQFTS